MKEVSLKSLKIALNFIESKNNPYEDQIVGSIGPKYYNSKKALFFDIMPDLLFTIYGRPNFALIDFAF